MKPQSFTSAAELVPIYKGISAAELAVLCALKFVKNPEMVMVSIQRGQQTTIIELDIPKKDRGRFIGQNGHIIRAVQSIASAAAGEHHILVTLLDEDYDPTETRRNGRSRARRNGRDAGQR